MKAYVRNILGEKWTLFLEINKCKHMYFGHVRLRASLKKMTMEGMVVGHRSRVQPTRRWIHSMQQFTGKSTAESVKLVMGGGF